MSDSSFAEIPNIFGTEYRRGRPSFFRRDLFQNIRQLLDSDDKNLLSVIGYSGSGKSSTINELIKGTNSDVLFIKIPITRLDLSNDTHMEISIKKNVLFGLENFPLLNSTALSKIEKYSPKIFISYTSPDREAANDLYNLLLDAGYNPWMDKKNILPGENWDEAISLAIREADFFILLLSKQLVEKRGYVRQEINKALSKSNQMLPRDIYLIPVRIDNCKMPDELSTHQWADLYSENGFERIKTAINIGIERRKLGIKHLESQNTIENYVGLNDLSTIFSKFSCEFPETKLIIIFDDFDKVELLRGANKQVLGRLGSFLEELTHVHNVKVVTVGNRPHENLITKMSPNISNVEIRKLEVGPYPIQQLIEETRERLSDHVVFENKVIDELVGLSGGNLYCYQLIFDGVIRYLNRNQKKILSADDIENVLEIILGSEDRYDFQYFWNSIPPGLRLFLGLSLNYENPSEGFQISDLSKSNWMLIFSSKEEAVSQTNKLVQRGYLEYTRYNNLHKYRISVPLFALWIAKSFNSLEDVLLHFVSQLIYIVREENYDALFGSGEWRD